MIHVLLIMCKISCSLISISIKAIEMPKPLKKEKTGERHVHVSVHFHPANICLFDFIVLSVTDFFINNSN